jgi:hypothetical protein
MSSSNVTKAAITGLATVHLVTAIWHGHAHETLSVTLPPAKNAFVFVVIVAAPILAAVLVWTRGARIGVWLFFLSMLGSLLFGVYHHYVLVSPDHVGHLPDGDAAVRSAFVRSAGAIALIEAVSVLYGAFCLRARPRRYDRGSDEAHSGAVRRS